MTSPKNHRWHTHYENNQKHLIRLISVLFALMMTSLIFTLTQLLNLLTPTLDFSLVPFLAFFISLEAFHAAQRIRDDHLTLFEKDWFLFRISELITLTLLIRLISFLFNISATLTTARQESILAAIFSWDFLLVLTASLIVWLIITLTHKDIHALQMNEADLTWEELNDMEMARIQARQNLLKRLFLTGAFLLLLVLITRNLLPQEHTLTTQTFLLILNLLLYFVCAIIVASLTNFSVQRARWLWENTEIDPSLLTALFQYGLLFLLILLAVTLFLPTNVTVGLLDFLRLIIGALFRGINWLLIGIFAILNAIIQFLSNLFPNQATDPLSTNLATPEPFIQSAPQIPQEAIPTTTAPTTANHIADIILWSILIIALIAGFIFYIRQNRHVFQKLRHLDLRSLWQAIRKAFRSFFKRVQTTLPTFNFANTRRKSKRTSSEKHSKPKAWYPTTDREKVFAAYLDALDQLESNPTQPVHRTPADTPAQYLHKLEVDLPDATPPMTDLTQAFSQARYSAATPEHDTIPFVERLTKTLRKILKRTTPLPGSTQSNSKEENTSS